MKASVTVIIPVYNAEDYIKSCAISLFKQTLDNIEYIFVNDASTDRSIDFLKDVISSFPNRSESIKIITHDKNKGLPEARRTGLLAATGDYIIHCDSDDWVEPTMYEEMYNAAVSVNADIVACNMWIDWGSSRKENKYPYTKETKETIKGMYMLNGIYSTLCNKLIKRSLYEENSIEPLPDVFMWEDFAMSFRLRLCSSKTIVIPKAFYHYMIYNGESVKRFNENKIRQQMDVAIFFESYIIDHYPKEADEYKTAISYVKFMSKMGYFTNLDTQDFYKWKHTFEETNHDLLKFTTIPLPRRLVYYIGLNYSPKLAYMIYDGIKKIVR